MNNEEQVFATLTEFPKEILPQPRINLSMREDGFDIKAKGYSEDFLLKLVASLKNDSVDASIVVKKPTITSDNDLNPETVQKVADDITSALKATVGSKLMGLPTTNTMNETQLKLKAEILANKEVPESLKERMPESNTEMVYQDADNKSTLADKFGDKARQLYETAGVKPDGQEKPDYYHTGIKINEQGKPRYRLHYSCPKCGATGRHYIPSHVKYVSCHTCNTPLVAEPATELGFGEDAEHRDSFGNFFVAEVIDYNALNKK